jgi:DNA repair protein RadA/Sms
MTSVNLDASTQTLPIFSKEVNRVLGGGIVKGSVVLLAGEPGMGKSTLLLQLAASVVENSKRRVVYLSGEENSEQIAARAKRLGLDTSDIFLICDIDADEAIANILDMDDDAPAMIIVDSIQTMRTGSSPSSMGSVTQTRESAARFVQLAKSTGSAVLLVGHVTKSGEVAGPRILEHMVDTVLYLEGSTGSAESQVRLLRGIKNRFGSTSEVGVLSMTETGMEDVTNPSELFLSGDSSTQHGQEGSAVAVVLEGSRPLLAEIQCLVSAASPRATNVKRMSDGFPVQRLLLICAVIEKRLRLPLWNRDVYVNVAGGLRVSEPASDLAVAMTVISSLTERNVKAGIAFIGEIGLGGELRSAKGAAQRVKEASKLGFSTVIVPKACMRGLNLPSLGLDPACKVIGCDDLQQVMNRALETTTRPGGGKSRHYNTGGGGGSHYPPNGDIGGYNYPPGGGDGEEEDGFQATGPVIGAVRGGTPPSSSTSFAYDTSEEDEYDAYASDDNVMAGTGRVDDTTCFPPPPRIKQPVAKTTRKQKSVRMPPTLKYENSDDDGDDGDDEEEKEEEDRARFRVPQFYSPGEDLRAEDAAAAAKAARYGRRNYRRKK